MLLGDKHSSVSSMKNTAQNTSVLVNTTKIR